ncbi:MAG TPA: response regulator transcription factor [Candidatus Eisenbacteria bacterium]
MIRALVADDHAVVRRGLTALFGESGDIVVGGEATNAQEALDLVRRGGWDVVVLDINLPDSSGLDLLATLKRERADLPVLILTICAEEQFALRALRSGAAGYVTKESPPEELIRAVRKVVDRGRYVSPAVAERLARWVDSSAGKPPHETLSEREFQIFHLLASGRSVGEAASLLHLSVKTVSTYRARVLEKMNLKTNAELTLYAVRNHLIE